MNILLIGYGGREHALAWKMAQSELCSKLFIAPGNAGTAQCGTNVELGVTDFENIKHFCLTEKIELVVIGPEEPLVKGIVDDFRSDATVQHIPVIGPSQQGAQLEGSKAFAKRFMHKYNIPTAIYKEFDSTNYEEGIPYLQDHTLPIVLKADGLAGGKGVIICQSHLEAMSEYELMIQQSKFGEAGKRVVVEDFLTGIELSVFVLTDGKNYVVLPEAKDYKKIGEGDKGPNTGGMGAVSPVPFADDEFMKKVEEQVIKPTVDGLHKEGIDYKGFIFIGLMKVGSEPYVIEYNCRLGDPETEVVIPRLRSDLVQLLKATADQQLDQVTIDIDPRVACAVVAVSGGYPGNYEKGLLISGLDNEVPEESLIFHAGTTVLNGNIVTSGGRVLCVTSYGDSVTEAVYNSKMVLGEINFEDIYYRRDIGFEFE
ncbi:MAG TPA: phosphoribosylamine--glycine ligase [Flavitalea sp.]|nr:phosphoribosylamine--glycine ligase [Flavitalea sp.]